jgi:hypothetical protein
VFLDRGPDEPEDRDLRDFYRKLFQAVYRPVFREGRWSLCGRTGWPDNASFQNLVAWSWQKDDERYLIAVNLSDFASQGQIQVPWAGDEQWILMDPLSGMTYERSGDQMQSPGLYVELAPWDYHFFQCMPMNKT